MNPFRRTATVHLQVPDGYVVIPLAEYHAERLALDSAVDRISELEAIDETRGAVLAQQVETIAERTAERDRARETACMLEEDSADLGRANDELKRRVTVLEQQLVELGTQPAPLPPLGTDDIEGVPA